MKPLLLNILDKSPLTDAIKRRVYGHMMCYNILIVGDPQSRKSTAALTIAKQLFPDFDLDNDMAVIDGNKFMDILRSPSKRGQVKLADDFGIGMNHRAWHSFLNKALNYAIQTHGFKGLIVMVTVPYESYIDSDARKLFNMELTTVAKSDGERWVKLRAEELFHIDDFRTHTTKTYKTLLRVRHPDGIITKLQNIKVFYPPQDFLNRYFEVANHQKNKLQDDLKAEAMAINKKQNRDAFNPDKFVNEIIEHQGDFVKEWHGLRLIDHSMVQSRFGMSIEKAKQVKALTEKKLNIGWNKPAEGIS